jgi:hypothetical protein
MVPIMILNNADVLNIRLDRLLALEGKVNDIRPGKVNDIKY